MGAHIKSLGVSYFPVPKCACTSLKHFFFELENGRKFRRYTVNDRLVSIQEVYLTEPFEKAAALRPTGAWAFAVVRSPASRVVSCYRNRVVARNPLERTRVAAAIVAQGLPAKPSLSEFVANLEAYRKLSPSVAHHTMPLSHFLGTEPGFFDRIYNLRELPVLTAELAARLKREVPTLRNRQTAGPPLSERDLSEAERRRIDELYSEDNEVFGKYF
jgi:hypothetical protein